MKKIVVLFLCFSVIGCVSADTYYSDYSKFSTYQEDAVIGNDCVEIQTEDRYLWYQEKEIGDYFILGENDSLYHQVDMSKMKETSFSKWKEEAPEDKPNRVIEQRTVYRYQDRKKARYVHLYGLQGKSNFTIVSLDISINNKKIDYDAVCTDCVKQDKYAFVVPNGGEIFLDLHETYPFEKLEITMVLHDETTAEKRYIFDVTYDEEGKEVLASRLSRLWFTNPKYDDKEIAFTGEESYQLKSPQWEEEHETSKEMEATSSRKVTKVEQYRYMDQLYYYYYLKRTYKEKYDTHGNKTYPLQDLNSKKTFYSYRTRNKIVLKEPIVISDEEMRLDDFILESDLVYSIDDSKVKWDSNGVYPITIKTASQKIAKEVMVTKNVEEKETPVEKPIDKTEDKEDLGTETVDKVPGDVVPVENENDLESTVESPETLDVSPQVVYQTVVKEDYEMKEKLALLEEKNLEQEKKIMELEQVISDLTNDLETCEQSMIQEDDFEEDEDVIEEAPILKQGIIPWSLLGILFALFIIVIGRKMMHEKKF